MPQWICEVFTKRIVFNMIVSFIYSLRVFYDKYIFISWYEIRRILRIFVIIGVDFENYFWLLNAGFRANKIPKRIKHPFKRLITYQSLPLWISTGSYYLGLKNSGFNILNPFEYWFSTKFKKFWISNLGWILN